MHMTIQLLLQLLSILFIAYVVVSVVAIILFSRYFYLRGVQKGWAMKEQPEQVNTTQRTNVFTRLWEPSAKRS